MQPNPSAPAPSAPNRRSRTGLLPLVGVLLLIAAAGIGGYLVGASQVAHATLRIQVANTTNANLTTQVTVNGALAGTLTIPSGKTASLDVAVAYATANGATFDVEAFVTPGLNDSKSVFVNTPGIYVVGLTL